MILVTGSTGMLGARLIYDLLSGGKKIRAMRKPSSPGYIIDAVFSGQPELKHGIEWVDGNVTDVYDVREAMEGVDEVYHCAAKVSFRAADFREIMKVNVEGTANMVNMALELGIKKFCHVSSIAALGRVEENKVMDETVVWKSSKQNSNYAISKYNGEREVWRAMEEGLKAVIVNPGIIIGPGDWKTGSSAMFMQSWNGMKFYSEGVNGFVDVRDVSSCMIKLMEKEMLGEKFILIADNWSYHQVFDCIADGLGKSRPTVAVGKLLSELGWRAETLRTALLRSTPFITKETARNSQYKWYYSNQKIKRALGHQFIPLEKSIDDTAKVFFTNFVSSPKAAVVSNP